jgi:prophage antirepressor-like protein
MPTKQEIATNPTTANDNEVTALLRAFEFEGGDIRILDSNGDPWFVLADVCRVLGIDPADPVRRNRLDDDELRSVDMSFHMVNIQGANINGLGLGAGNNITNLVSESGMYRLVLTSRKPEARRFKKWVVGAVLPEARRIHRQARDEIERGNPGRRFEGSRKHYSGARSPHFVS